MRNNNAAEDPRTNKVQTNLGPIASLEGVTVALFDGADPAGTGAGEGDGDGFGEVLGTGAGERAVGAPLPQTPFVHRTLPAA